MFVVGFPAETSLIKPLPADAGRIGCVLLDVLKYGLVIHHPARGAEVTPCPEPAAPVSLSQFGELHLDLSRAPALDPAHHVTDREMGRDRDEHMDMIGGQDPADDRDPQFLANLPCDLPHSLPDRARQNLVSIFRNPNNVIAVMEHGVFAFVISHDL